MTHQTRQARILASGIYLPEKRLTNQDLEQMVDTSDEWIVSRTGMRERRIAGSEEFASTMGTQAAQRALERAGIDPLQVDLIACATTTPDYLFPNTASLIQDALGATNAVAFDLQAACTGYLYGLQLAKGLIESGTYKNVLLVATEKLSCNVDYEDRNTCILFGDGAGASLISSEGKGLLIEQVRLGTDGSQAMLLTIPGGGCRQPVSHQSISDGQHFIKMQGREIFKHAVRRMTQVIEEVLEQGGLTLNDINWMVPHQANVRIVDLIVKNLGLPREKLFMNVHKYGNTSASSVPIALTELLEQYDVAAGERLVLSAFGAGLCWGTAILKQITGK